MRTNNAIISNNQSKDLIALWCVQVKTRAKLLLPFTCNFHYSYSLRIVVIFFHFHYSHTTLHSTNRAGVITGRCFNLITSNAYWFCIAVFHAFSAPNVMEFVCLYAAVAFSPFLDEGKEQRLVESCVFRRNAMVSSPPSFLICVLLQVDVPSFVYITGACTLWSERQYCD